MSEAFVHSELQVTLDEKSLPSGPWHSSVTGDEPRTGRQGAWCAQAMAFTLAQLRQPMSLSWDRPRNQNW